MTYDYPWAEECHLPWGFLPRDYVLLEIDSFGPRGIVSVCDSDSWSKASPQIPSRDAHAGKDYLASLPYVDDDRIAVLGWSHGGMTTLSAVSNRARNEPPRLDP
ncbi:MAG: prolyl oligopeptidase family serine peptidase [Alphaproteobacteria bacterium]